MASLRLRVGLGAGVVVILGVLVVAVVVGALSSSPATSFVADGGEPVRSTAPSAILVHVSGAVASPGVYSVQDGARVIDAVAAAGGLAEGSAADAINLVRPLADGEQLHVPRTDDTAPPSGSAGPDGPVGSTGPGAATRINLNRATVAELETLPRVGPALAQRIIDFRNANGPFSTVEDLQAVSGIGDQTFAGLRELVSV